MKSFLIITILFICYLIPVSKGQVPVNANKSIVQASSQNDSTFIYGKIYEADKGDEYAEGTINLYDIKKHKSYQISKDEIVDKTEAWITTNGKIIVFSISGISVFDKNRKKIEGSYFGDNETMIGANYNKQKESIYFLLKNIKTEKVELCQFTVEKLELKRIKANLNIQPDDVEAPPKKLFFTENNTLLIENDVNSLLSIELYGQYNSHIIKYETGFRYSYAGDFNKEGFVYLRYKDKKADMYEIKQYFLSTGKIVKLFEGRNINSNGIPVYIYSNQAISPFVIVINSKYYIYDYKSFKEIKIDKDSDIAYISKDKVYFLTKNGNINTVSY